MTKQCHTAVRRQAIAAVAILTLVALSGNGAGAQSPSAAASVVRAGTAIAIRTGDLIDSRGPDQNREFPATVDDSIVVDGVTAVPVGAQAFLRVVQVQQAGAVRGRASLSLRLVGLEINGQRIVLETGNATILSSSQAKKATGAAAGGAVVGGILGALLGGKDGALTGAAVGATAGVAAAAVSGQRVRVPAETRLSFALAQDVDLEAPAIAGR
jgi:hypothetical protein